MKKRIYKVATPVEDFTMALTERDANLIKWFVNMGKLGVDWDEDDPYITIDEIDIDDIVEFEG